MNKIYIANSLSAFSSFLKDRRNKDIYAAEIGLLTGYDLDCNYHVTAPKPSWPEQAATNLTLARQYIKKHNTPVVLSCNHDDDMLLALLYRAKSTKDPLDLSDIVFIDQYGESHTYHKPSRPFLRYEYEDHSFQWQFSPYKTPAER